MVAVIAFHRIDRQVDAVAAAKQAAFRPHRDDDGVAGDRAGRSHHSAHMVAFDVETLDRRAVEKLHAELFRSVGGEFLDELPGLAGLVDRRIDAAGDLVLRIGKAGLELDQAVATDDLDRQAMFGEKPVVVGAGVETVLRAEEIEDALLALVIVDAGIGRERVDAVAGVERQAQFDLTVGAQALFRAFPAGSACSRLGNRDRSAAAP